MYTAGTNATLTSCSLQDPQIIHPEYLIKNVGWATFIQYDCIFIPSGEHWNPSSTYDGASELISSAYRSGLIIASLCIGMVVLARAGILNGIKIACDYNAWRFMQNSGAIMIQQDVVTYNRIVTGGPGGGPSGGGANAAPTIEVCEAIASEIQARNIFITIGVITGVVGVIMVVGLIIYIRKKKTR